MRAIALLAVLSLLMAGCSGNPDDGGSDATPSSSSTTTSTGPPPKPVVYSDTLHFLEAPSMAPALPLGSSESRTPTSGGFGGGGGGGGQNDDPTALWEYPLTNGANITGGEIHVWIEITEILVQQPLGFPPGETPCTWYLILELGADNDANVPCLSEPVGLINPGTKELVFSFLATDPYMLQANETISARFARSPFGISTEPSVYVLSGSTDHDSRAVLRGLQEAIDA